MATLTVPYSFNTNTSIVASEMNSNFGAVKTFVEALAAGTNIDTGAIDSTKLATSAIQLLTPTGSIVQYAGATAPTGWLLCDGTAYSQTTYAALYAVIGSNYNTSGGQAAPSAGNFRVPLLTGRVPVGRDATQTEFDTLGETGGSKTSTAPHTHDIDHNHAAFNWTHDHGSFNISGGDHDHGIHRSAVELATGTSGYYGVAVQDSGTQQGRVQYSGALSMSVDVPSFTGSIDIPSLGTTASGPSSAAATSGNLQPYIVVNYIIKI